MLRELSLDDHYMVRGVVRGHNGNFTCFTPIRRDNLWDAEKIRSSGKNYFAFFPYRSHLFEVLEPNLMEINFKLTYFNLIQFNLI
jgi:hypothetical protein